jgi:hypothetical protein
MLGSSAPSPRRLLAETNSVPALQTWRALDLLQCKPHFWRNCPRHEVDFILEQNRKLVTLGIKTGSTMTGSDDSGSQALRDSLKRNQHRVRGVVLQAHWRRPLDSDVLALPGVWTMAGE